MITMQYFPSVHMDENKSDVVDLRYTVPVFRLITTSSSWQFASAFIRITMRLWSVEDTRFASILLYLFKTAK